MGGQRCGRRTISSGQGHDGIFWDGADKAALRIDLWTQQMMVDEMADFYYQTLMTMADTYGRATQYADQVEQMKSFAKTFTRRSEPNN